MATINKYKKFCEFGHVVFEICKSRDRHTDRHKDMLIAALYTPTRGEVIIIL